MHRALEKDSRCVTERETKKEKRERKGKKGLSSVCVDLYVRVCVCA